MPEQTLDAHEFAKITMYRGKSRGSFMGRWHVEPILDSPHSMAETIAVETTCADLGCDLHMFGGFDDLIAKQGGVDQEWEKIIAEAAHAIAVARTAASSISSVSYRSANTVIKLFANESGVLRLTTFSGKRKYVVLSIPKCVALHVHDGLSHDGLQAACPSRNPLRVVSLGDFHGRVSKKPRYVSDADAA
jgi:hypothetical protein